MKKFISFIIVIFSVFSLNILCTHGEALQILVNESILNSETPPFIENGFTMVPMRTIFESLDAEVIWNNEERSVTAIKENSVIKMAVESLIMQVNDEIVNLDIAPIMRNGLTFVPIRAVSQSLGYDVKWYANAARVYINSPQAFMRDSTIGGREKLITMYAIDGRTISIGEYDIEAYKNVGWYTAPPVLMYSEDGRTLYVSGNEVSAYSNVGWSTSKPAPAPNFNTNDNFPHSSTIYITPTGKRYHYSSSCAGKNATKSSLSNARSRGLTPCKKCT